jgi:cell wall-associated NlpC family hydrolase
MLQPRRALARAALAAACGATLVPIAGALAGASAAGAAVVVADDLRGAGTVSVAQQALSALQHADQAPYTIFRQRLAALVAPAAGVDPRQLDERWRVADPRRMVTVLSALTQLGVPYHSRGATPGRAFDCSGLTSWAWSQSGVGLPHQSGGQIRSVSRVDLSAVQPGDLLYYPGHVMLALGIGGAIVHAPNSGNVVEVRMLSEHQQGRLRAGDPLG